MAKSRGTGWRLSPMFLIVLAIYSLDSVSGKPERRSRHVTSGRSSDQLRENTRPWVPSSANSLTFGENEQEEEEEGRRATHRLVGGHVRFRPTARSSSIQDQREERENHERAGEDTDDEAVWDDGLIIASAGNGREKTTRPDDDDEKKTLSQQVKEGKYGLIQNEIHSTSPERPGVISYLSNPEIPKDNARNFGGLDEEEIWLAENHVLVLRGGNFPDHDKEQRVDPADLDDWSPIDDYKAPKRQVKIPPSPKVPPPFPVQLSEGGPIRIIGDNETSPNDESSKIYDDDDRDSAYRGFLPGEGPFFAISKNRTFQSKDLTSRENTTKKLGDNDRDRKIKSGQVPPPRNNGVIGPFYPALPPGAVFVAPPNNQSDYDDDDDDQSIYYPPPYSFYYKQDNSTPVPPGPLVPGIILPPPPDFFSGMEEKKPLAKSHPAKYPKRAGTATPPRGRPTYYTQRKSTPQTHKDTTSGGNAGKASTAKSRPTSFTMKPVSDIKYKTTTARSTEKPRKTNASFTQNVTTPASIDNATSLEIAEVYTPKPSSLMKNTISEATTTTKSKIRWSPSVSSDSVPLVTFYSSSTPSPIDDTVDATPISVNNINTDGKQRVSPHQASYYFYEESNEDVTVEITPNPMAHHRATTESPFYDNGDFSKFQQQQQQQQEKRQQEKKSHYEPRVVPTAQPFQDYRAESLDPLEKTSYRYQPGNSLPSTNSASSSRAKSQRMLAGSSPSYYEDITVQSRDQSYYTTIKPQSFTAELGNEDRYDYDRGTKPKPIYQYSYESADYSRHKQQRDQYKPEEQRAYYDENVRQTNPTSESFQEWQDIPDESQQYDYEEALSERVTEPERENNGYRNRFPVTYRATTNGPISETTINPQHAYYTKQDDQLLDEVTREYFTNFGKKLRGGSLPNTTPIYGKSNVVTDSPDYGEVETFVSNDYDNAGRTTDSESPNVRVQYGDNGQRPYSLEGDIDVNYKNPPPPINPDSEWIPAYNDPKQSSNLPLLNYQQHQRRINNNEYSQGTIPTERFSSIKNYDQQGLIERSNNPPTNFVPVGNDGRTAYASARPISLKDDLVVNYRDPRPPVNPDAEYIDPAAVRGDNNNNNNNNDEKASYFAYRLPGDGGHFYFLTPQAISQRQDDNVGYVYPRPRGARLLRQRRRGPRRS